MKQKLPFVGICILIFAGVLVLAYPTVSSMYNQKYQMQAIVDYQDNVDGLQNERIQNEWNEARQYNQALTGADIEDPFIPGSGVVLPDNYMSILDFNDGIMGYIEIPAVDIYLPLYHGTSEKVLVKGVGHMEMTAFPIGGEGNHSVLTGHTALPNALLFTNLQDMVLDDVFYIHILKETLAYQVDQIVVVEPTQTEQLKPVEGEDYVTLLTCTPYAINSHRLLVRGRRIPYEDAVEVMAPTLEGPTRQLPYSLIVLLVVLALLLAIGVVGVCRRRAKRKKRRWRR